jgi:hypothetical protein
MMAVGEAKFLAIAAPFCPTHRQTACGAVGYSHLATEPS